MKMGRVAVPTPCARDTVASSRVDRCAQTVSCSRCLSMNARSVFGHLGVRLYRGGKVGG